jgi:hypothetical protein
MVLLAGGYVLREKSRSEEFRLDQKEQELIKKILRNTT